MQQRHRPIFQQWDKWFVSCTEDERLQAASAVLTLKHCPQCVAVFANPVGFDASHITDRQNGFFITGSKRSQSRKLSSDFKGGSPKSGEAIDP